MMNFSIDSDQFHENFRFYYENKIWTGKIMLSTYFLMLALWSLKFLISGLFKSQKATEMKIWKTEIIIFAASIQAEFDTCRGRSYIALPDICASLQHLMFFAFHKKRQKEPIHSPKAPIWRLQHCNTCCPAKRYHLAERRPKMCAPRTLSRPGDVLGQPFPSYSKWVL